MINKIIFEGELLTGFDKTEHGVRIRLGGSTPNGMPAAISVEINDPLVIDKVAKVLKHTVMKMEGHIEQVVNRKGDIVTKKKRIVMDALLEE